MEGCHRYHCLTSYPKTLQLRTTHARCLSALVGQGPAVPDQASAPGLSRACGQGGRGVSSKGGTWKRTHHHTHSQWVADSGPCWLVAGGHSGVVALWPPCRQLTLGRLDPSEQAGEGGALLGGTPVLLPCSARQTGATRPGRQEPLGLACL